MVSPGRHQVAARDDGDIASCVSRDGEGDRARDELVGLAVLGMPDHQERGLSRLVDEGACGVARDSRCRHAPAVEDLLRAEPAVGHHLVRGPGRRSHDA